MGKRNPTAYLGITIPGFPNFFCMMGPNSGPAHGGSIVFRSECQSRYITSCLVRIWKKARQHLRSNRSFSTHIPISTDIEQRNRALIAFTILTGARDGVIALFKLRHIDITEGRIDQGARELQTKFSKSFVTAFFPVGDDIQSTVVDWSNTYIAISYGGWTIRSSLQLWWRWVAIFGSKQRQTP